MPLGFVQPLLAVGMWPRHRHNDATPLSGLSGTKCNHIARWRVLLNEQSVIETLAILDEGTSEITRQLFGIWPEKESNFFETLMHRFSLSVLQRKWLEELFRFAIRRFGLVVRQRIVLGPSSGSSLDIL